MTDKLNIAICEDTKKDVEKLTEMIEKCELSSSYTIFNSGEAFLAAYRPMTYDLLLIDIYMGGITGVETVKRLRVEDPDLPVAFVTSSLDFALEGYRLSALKYIEKPYSQKDIDEILKMADIQKQSRPSLTVLKNRKEEKIWLSSILYMEQRDHRLYITENDGTEIQVYEKLSKLLPELEKQGFFSPHKSYAVNLTYVQSIDSELRCFVMRDQVNIPIRRESMAKAGRVYREYLFDKTRRLTL